MRCKKQRFSVKAKIKLINENTMGFSNRNFSVSFVFDKRILTKTRIITLGLVASLYANVLTGCSKLVY